MNAILSDVNSTVASIEQIYTSGMTSEMTTSIIVVILGFISFVVSIYSLFKRIDKKIDERIDSHIKPSLELLHDTVGVVRNLEKNTAEMNATLRILKDILLAHKNI